MLRLDHTGDKLVVRLAPSAGSYGVCVFCSLMAAYLLRLTVLSYDASAQYLWWSFNRESLLGCLVCVAIALVSVMGEVECCVLDHKRDSVLLMRKLPFQSEQRYVLPPLHLVAGVTLETHEAKPHFERLVLEYKSGQSFPLTESYVDTRPGLLSSARLRERKKEIKAFLMRAEAAEQ